jgi:mono/diheme cytochrome c family protein
VKGRKVAIGVLAVLVIAAGVLWLLFPRDQEIGDAPPPLHSPTANAVKRGRELVVLADCRACHTTRGSADFSGRNAIPTPFGTFYSPNITPDIETGIGRWTADEFWRALHNGTAPDGRLLYPAFPYTNYTKISRADADAMFAYLRTIAPVRLANLEHELSFPYSQRWLLFAWRALFFRPGVYEADPKQSAEWNRGAYLTQGLVHCSACHEARNSLGGIQAKDNPAGGLVLNWYAPALTNRNEAGLQDWSEADIVTLLKTGQVSNQAPGRHTSALGPMAEVVFDSLQHVKEDELHAMAVYLKSLPETRAPTDLLRSSISPSELLATHDTGKRLYEDHCASCHGDNGEGRPPAAPPLAGNRAVNMSSANDPIHIVLYGGFPPGTAGNPRPFGMPPFYPTLLDGEIASVLTYVRSSWGNTGRPVSVRDVEKNRTGPLW